MEGYLGEVKVPKRVAFFLRTTIHCWILILDNLMLKGLSLANRCCMCCCNEEFVDHLLIHCSVVHSLWVDMLQIFDIQWVKLGSVESLMFCWNHWLGKFNSDIWNMVPGYLMWIVWTESNQRSFEAFEKSLVQLQALCRRTLFDCSRCWGSSNCSFIIEFLSSLRIVSRVFFL